MDFSKIVGILHLFSAIIKYTYGYIFPKTRLFDALYFILFAMLPLAWMFFKGECIISYIVKKYETPNYIMGSKPNDHKDLYELFYNKKWYDIYSNIATLVYLGSLILVQYRSRIIPSNIFYPALGIFTYCSLYTEQTMKYYPYLQMIFSLFLFAILYYSSVEVYKSIYPGW
jgi:hypothetical protein